MNPLGVSVGDRVNSSLDTEVTGAVLNIEAGGNFNWATAELDTDAISKILDTLTSQFYTIAQVPSILYGQSNVANVSEVSLKLLYNNANNLAKCTSFNLKTGIEKRFEYISTLLGIDISFNYNRPVDISSLVADIKTQIELGLISKETGMKVSPYIIDVEKEITLIYDTNIFHTITLL